MLHKDETVIRCQGHLQYVRGFRCCIEDRAGHVCGGNTEAMHVRVGTDGSMGKKPGDNWTIPGCVLAHREQHQIGEPAFELKYRIDMKAIVAGLWVKSPHLVK